MPLFPKLSVPQVDDLGLGNINASASRRSRNLANQQRIAFGLVITSLLLYLPSDNAFFWLNSRSGSSRIVSPDVLARCRALDVKPGPPDDFYERVVSDRFVPGTNATLIKNATIWTGNLDGAEVITGDLYLDGGIIKQVITDSSQRHLFEEMGLDVDVIDANGAWVTPGIVDVHSHIGVGASPELNGAEDSNSVKGPTQPWLRSLDGLNTHDASYELAIAGGLTTSLILPGSADAMGGQAFAIKMRPTSERTPTSLLLEPPHGTNGSDIDYTKKPRWRHMKHACGTCRPLVVASDPLSVLDYSRQARIHVRTKDISTKDTSQFSIQASVFGQVRMDSEWQLRSLYDTARQIKESQDSFCEKALNGFLDENAKFPENLQYEAAVDILRGKVRVQTHCYEAVDLDNFVRLTNEFKFPIAAFHHAHESYLVPDLLKKAYGDTPPALAMFASFSRYKREAFRHSVFAPRILHDAGLRVVMKSDHAAIVSRYLLHEAQQAHYFGLPSNFALASVTSTAAGVIGYDHRIGYIREGYDADVVLWDSHPLQLGATPKQVFIDGIPQLKSPHVVEKPEYLQDVPETPDFDKETRETIEYEGLPPLLPRNTSTDAIVIFTCVRDVWSLDSTSAKLRSSKVKERGVVVTRAGEIICTGSCSSYVSLRDATFVDLEGGSIAPGLVSFGSDLGLQEIGMEATTTDGTVIDALSQSIPKILGENPVIRASDGLIFATRNALLAYRAGVTSAITAPASNGFFAGLSAYFSTGASLKTTPGAVIQDATSLHFAIGSVGQPSVSTQIAALRRLLTVEQDGELGTWIGKVLTGDIPLVIDVHSADHIATLLSVKKEVESATGTPLRLTLTGASEAHLLAQELGEASVGVILNPVRPFPSLWDQRRILPGPPLSEESALVHLMKQNVTVGFGVAGGNLPSSIRPWAAHNTRFDVSWAFIEAGGQITVSDAFALASTNVEKLLGVDTETSSMRDLVVTKGGGLLDIEAKVVGIISPRRGQVELF